MTDAREGIPVRPPRDEVALAAAAEEARERQSWVRHELRAPLAVIYPLLSLLQDGGSGALTAQPRELLEVLERNIARLEALITGVVDSGWADCSPAPPLTAEVALGDLAEQVATRQLADETGGPDIRVEAGMVPSPRAWADTDDVRQILTGLVRNACAYAGAGAVRIVVRDGDDPGAVAVEVVDVGPGMPPEELGRAFDFGFRGELARTLKVPGLGAGLWVCRALALRNGGSLSLASEPNGGLTATLTLPSSGEAS